MNRIDLANADWRKSTFSGNSGGDCVEVAALGEHVAVRDSKNPDRDALVFPTDAWRAFLENVDDLS